MTTFQDVKVNWTKKTSSGVFCKENEKRHGFLFGNQVAMSGDLASSITNANIVCGNSKMDSS